VQLGGAAGRCSWAVQLGRAAGQCSWAPTLEPLPTLAHTEDLRARLGSRIFGA